MTKTKKSTSTAAMGNSLDLLLKAVSEMYPSDRSGPGIVCAWLPKTREYYVSLCRYMDYAGGNKTIVASAKGATFNDAATAVSRTWLESTGHIQRLRESLR